MATTDGARAATIAVHPVAALFPMLSEEELQELAADIKANGLQQPIVLDDEGRVVDGRNRNVACGIAGVEPRFETLDGDPVAHIVSANLQRRHLSKGQRAMLAVRLEAEVMKNSSAEAAVVNYSPTRAVARVVGVDHAMIVAARLVLSKTPDAVKSVIDGPVPLGDAYKLARTAKRTREQAERAAKQVDEQFEQLLEEKQRQAMQQAERVARPSRQEAAGRSRAEKNSADEFFSPDADPELESEPEAQADAEAEQNPDPDFAPEEPVAGAS